MKTRPLTMNLPLAFLLVGLGCFVLQSWAGASEALPANGANAGLPQHSSWTAPTAQQVQQKLAAWLETQNVSPQIKANAMALWASPPVAEEMLDRLAASLALIDPQWEGVVEYSQAGSAASPPVVPGLAEATIDPLVKNNLRLLLGRTLVQNRLIDEAQEQLKGLVATDVVDPAGLLYMQCVISHSLLEKEACLAAATKLLENERQIPRRYATLARLIQADMAPLKTDSLDEVSRLMEDVRRRLELGRAGTQVRDQEALVVSKLEKMIEEMEDELKKQQQKKAGGAAPGAPAATKPADASSAPGMRAPGEVDPKDIGKKSGWGNLPPKERQEVLQNLFRDLPSQYRETFDAYTKRLSQDEK